MEIVQRFAGEKGQMTVEFMVALPVLIVVAVLAVNALVFVSDCASFDRLARDAVRAHATSPGYGVTADDVDGIVTAALQEGIADNESVDVTHGMQGRLIRYRATLHYRPTLFGMGLREEVWGVRMPGIDHSVELVINAYRPGVIA